MGSLALTGQPPKRTPFEPLVPGVTHVPYGDVAALAAAVDDDTAAVFVEPVLGEGGVVPAPDGYLAAAREITSEGRRAARRRRGADRSRPAGHVVRLPAGRHHPGRDHAGQGPGRRPAAGCRDRRRRGGRPVAPGQHGTTFGGNPVCCAAGLAVAAHHRGRPARRARRRDRQGDRGRRRGPAPPAGHRRARRGPAAGHHAARPGRGQGRRRRAGRRLHRQPRAARRGAAGPAAGHRPPAGQGLRRGTAGRAGRGGRS